MDAINNKGNHIYRSCRNCNFRKKTIPNWFDKCTHFNAPIYNELVAENCDYFNCDEK